MSFLQVVATKQFFFLKGSCFLYTSGSLVEVLNFSRCTLFWFQAADDGVGEEDDEVHPNDSEIKVISGNVSLLPKRRTFQTSKKEKKVKENRNKQ